MKIETGNIKTKWLDFDYLDITLRGKVLRYAATGSSSVKRARSILTKEPTTLAWMDGFDEGQSMFDIGANVGMYTIYAAVMRKAKVWAFEPESLNYAELNKNIYLNNLHNDVLAYCLALSDVDKVDRLLLSDFGLGISYHDFEENSWKGDQTFAADWIVKKDERRPQGCIGKRVDALITEGLPAPEHIKIDVDGLEHRVLGGMVETLRNPKIETILLEVNFDEKKNIDLIDQICSMGWRYSFKQISCNRHTIFTEDQIERFKKDGKGGLNYIFYRDEKWDRYWDDFTARYVPGDVSSYFAE
jgi:FkbM family methyltransferase